MKQPKGCKQRCFQCSRHTGSPYRERIQQHISRYPDESTPPFPAKHTRYPDQQNQAEVILKGRRN
ncbi:hypothetical protein [Treponema vincentii]|uniref:hypothetical protein n=1 Tax=Treponema vincentii TaxID=69710 RepID=UPI003D933C9A